MLDFSTFNLYFIIAFLLLYSQQKKSWWVDRQHFSVPQLTRVVSSSSLVNHSGQFSVYFYLCTDHVSASPSIVYHQTIVTPTYIPVGPMVCMIGWLPRGNPASTQLGFHSQLSHNSQHRLPIDGELVGVCSFWAVLQRVLHFLEGESFIKLSSTVL